MKRILIFLLLFIVATIAVFIAAGIPNFNAFKTLFKNTDGMQEGYEYVESTYSLKGLTEFIGEHPEFMSIVSFNVEDPDSGIYYGADIPRTQGTIANFFLLTEYARQVQEGIIDPATPVNLDDINRYALPQISENAHNSGIELLEAIEDRSITIDDVVSVMIATNDLASSDYIWFTLGPDNIFATVDSLQLEHTDYPLPFSGLYLSIQPSVSDTSRTYTDDEIIALAQKFGTDDAFHSEMIDLFKSERLNISFIEEKNALAKFPQTTAREMANLMAKVERDELLNKEITRLIKDKLSWVNEGKAIQRSFSNYGAIYDNRLGMLSGVDYGTSIYDGHTSAQAVFFDRLPVAFFIHLSANHMQEDYQQRLIWDPALYETTIQEITQDK
ncbi:serine hydrolase [Balneola vulgaris]|uniref:serine hydrolase n=1 Tax=Balneola vulgaris TaxID=287535 RepID=UPI0012FCB9A6|nr:serine hydrolase [Balneola vulgaris]